MGCGTSSAAQAKRTLPVLTESTAVERALTQLKLIFDSIDANEDRSVSKAELTAALDKDESLGALVKEAGYNLKFSVLGQLETCRDGCLSWEEFQASLMERAVNELMQTGNLAAAELPAHEKVLEHLRAIFESIDANEDGAVSKEELALKLKADTDEHGLVKDGTFGRLLEEAGFNPNFRTFDGLDTNKDGLITWDEFRRNLDKAAAEQVKEYGEVMAATAVLEEREHTVAACGCW